MAKCLPISVAGELLSAVATSARYVNCICVCAVECLRRVVVPVDTADHTLVMAHSTLATKGNI